MTRTRKKKYKVIKWINFFHGEPLCDGHRSLADAKKTHDFKVDDVRKCLISELWEDYKMSEELKYKVGDQDESS